MAVTFKIAGHVVESLGWSFFRVYRATGGAHVAPPGAVEIQTAFLLLHSVKEMRLFYELGYDKSNSLYLKSS